MDHVIFFTMLGLAVLIAIVGPYIIEGEDE